MTKKRHGLAAVPKKLTMEEVEELGYVRKEIALGENKCLNCMNKYNNNICKKIICKMSYWEDPKFMGVGPIKRAYFIKKRNSKLNDA